MTNTERKQIIQNAINEYTTAKAGGNIKEVYRAINSMENVYIMVAMYAVEGGETLRQLILSAKEENACATITPANIHAIAAATMKPEEIDHWYSDLYLKVTPISKSLVDRYEYKHFVTVFRDQIEGLPWYEIPFAFDRAVK